MQVQGFIFNLTSEQPERLTAFYRDVVQLPPAEGMGETAFNAGGATFIIDGHSETKGSAKEPQRDLINFMVDDIATEEQRLRAQGVPCLRSQGREYWGGVISTFTDPDGNYFQLIEYKPE
jgi:predicted enzyme related to lactoylglutathione lyase